MKITKLVHACLLVEDQGKVILIDPGNYSWDSGIFEVGQLPKIDYILITHEHLDHCYPNFISAIILQSPNVQIISNSSVVAKLKSDNINATDLIPIGINMEVVQHEYVPWAQVPLNSIFQVFSKLTHPGDNLSFSNSTEILAIPIQSPWGSVTWAYETILKTKPKTVIPIHDWHWNDEARAMLYDRAYEFFQKHDINFIKIKNGEAVEI